LAKEGTSPFSKFDGQFIHPLSATGIMR
jgi:hypothetical protein